MIHTFGVFISLVPVLVLLLKLGDEMHGAPKLFFHICMIEFSRVCYRIVFSNILLYITGIASKSTLCIAVRPNIGMLKIKCLGIASEAVINSKIGQLLDIFAFSTAGLLTFLLILFPSSPIHMK